MSRFKLVKADARSRTIIATRNGIDVGTWSQWAYCKMSPAHLMDSLDNGGVTVKIRVEGVGRHTSYVHVDADFEGTYQSLGATRTAQQCVSKGVLEQNILATAGRPSRAPDWSAQVVRWFLLIDPPIESAARGARPNGLRRLACTDLRQLLPG